MTEVRIENGYGSVTLSGTGAGVIGLTGIEGLGLPEVTLNTATFTGQEGRVTLSSSRNARVVTLSGDIKWRDVDRTVRQMMKILSVPVTVTFTVGNRKRKIEARCTSFDPPFGRARYKSFAMQLESDSPYLSDVQETVTAVYTRENLLPFDYGSYFGSTKKAISRLTHSNTVTNGGDVRSEPVITIANTGGTTAKTDGITVKNETTGQKITLNYATKAGETVTVDIPNRIIYNEEGTNLINVLSDDSYLSDFWLEEGGNLLSCTTNGVGETVAVHCRFYNQYLEVMG